jgi:DUF4097 and DUF4098 domain-containing protein YvlB
MKKIAITAFLMIFSLMSMGAGGIIAAELADSFDYTGVRELIVEDAASFDVEISGGSGRSARADIYMPRNSRIEVRHEMRGSTLRVWVDWPSFRSIGPARLRMVFSVPRETELDVQASSGDVAVSDIRADEAKIETSSGDIELSDVEAELDVSSSSGNQQLSSCRGEKKLEASSGDITVTRSVGDVSAQTSSGNQRYDRVEGDLVAESSSGDISVSDYEGTMDLHASSGRLQGRDVRISDDSSFQTSSGNIDFVFADSLADYNFDLQSTSGRLTVGSTRGEGNLTVGGGRIDIVGRSTSGSQSYK